MKRYSLVLVMVALLLIMASSCFALFPSLYPPCSTATFVLQQGWYNGQLVWFICTDTNDINFATILNYPYKQMTLVKKLSSATSNGGFNGANAVFINTGYQQGPVFSTAPGGPNYSGIWEVNFVVWPAGVTPRAVYSVADIGVSGATVVSYYGTTQTQPAILDCPIIVIGPLGSPTYKLAQVMALNYKTKQVTLPAWYVYCQEQTTRYIDKATLIVPDVADPNLAYQLKANYAPGLASVPQSDTENFYYFLGVKPSNQFPVIQACPNGIGTRNTNTIYCPVMNYVTLTRNVPYLVFVNNSRYIESILVPYTVFTPSVPLSAIVDQPVPGACIHINAPVISSYRIQPATGGCPDP